MYVAKEDIKSVFYNKHGKPVVYADVNTIIEIISQSGEVAICKNTKTGVRFSCLFSQLSEVYVEVKKSEPIVEKSLFKEFETPIVSETEKEKSDRNKKDRKSKKSNQPKLF